MAYTVIWYGRQGIVDKMAFDAEKAAKHEKWLGESAQGL